MITNISNNPNQFAKNETSKDNKNEKTDKKTSLDEALKNPFFSKGESGTKLPKDYVSQVDQKLQQLLNKLLEQIKTANKDPDLAIFKNQKDLNFAPNFANEVKKLQIELSKIPEFEKLLKMLDELVKPAKDIDNKNLSSLVKNSGVFLEAKLNHSLKEQNLPQSFFNLLSTIKSASSENLKKDISNLDLKNLDTTSTLKELIHILHAHKKENKTSLETTHYKTLFKLFDKIENFKNYINKNPNSISQEKLQNIANNFIKDLNKNLALINKELAKPENIKIQNTHILKDLSQNIKDFITLLKDIKNPKNTQEIKQEILDKTSKEEIEEAKTPQKNNHETKEVKNKEEILNNEKNIKTSKEDTPHNKNTLENTKEETKESQKNTEELIKNEAKNQNSQHNNAKLEDIFKSTSGKILLEDIFKQSVSKNLNFTQNIQEALLNSLNKELGSISRKLNEVLKALDPKNHEAKNSLDDIKHIEKKLELSIKDLGKITPKDSTEISSELQKDIKSTLLQVSNLAKNLDNETILNQTNRLIAQLEFNQLLSLANNSIHTFLPFFWDDLEKSNVVFKRGKKDKFYAQINLEFEKLGKINVFLSLSNDKYIDINMMVENIDFRKKLYERAHELKKALVKVGLLSSNFFISDIAKSKFQNQEEYNDFNMGFDTRA